MWPVGKSTALKETKILNLILVFPLYGFGLVLPLYDFGQVMKQSALSFLWVAVNMSFSNQMGNMDSN